MASRYRSISRPVSTIFKSMATPPKPTSIPSLTPRSSPLATVTRLCAISAAATHSSVICSTDIVSRDRLERVKVFVSGDGSQCASMKDRTLKTNILISQDFLAT
ncbi:hypothetical protein R6Q57_016859, partial [Mikania cordata]